MNGLNFSIKDLLVIYDHIGPCFPESYKIFDFFEQNYKASVEKKLMPFLEEKEKIKASPGILILLASWLDSYELLVKKAGLNEGHYFELKFVNHSI